MDIPQALLSASNQDENLRKQAEEVLSMAFVQNSGQFMVTLAEALSAEDFPVAGRQTAGLYLKNVLDAKDYALQQQKIEAWFNLDVNLRTRIKQVSVATLKSNESFASHTAAQLVAKLGTIELPKKQWNELLPELMNNVTSGSEITKYSTLQALGYLCEGLEDNSIDQDDTNKVLTAIVDGIKVDNTDKIRLAAVEALRNSLEFVNENFKRDAERNHIMQVICEATQSKDIQIRVRAFECIATIATLYYEYLQTYMSALCQLTFKSVQEDDHQVGLQALEFWSSICDVELEFMYDSYYDQPTTSDNKHYVNSVMGGLIPLLLTTLSQQEDDQVEDDDAWNLSMAGATCLSLVAQVTSDACVDIVMDFVKANIASNDWRFKEAAIMAFGSIINGPSSNKIQPLVHEALPILSSSMQDPNALVRDTTAWTIGRICEFHGEVMVTKIPALMSLFNDGLSRDVKTIGHMCYAIHYSMQVFHEQGVMNDVVQFFDLIFDKVLQVCHHAQNLRNDNLRISGYEALGMLIQTADPHNVNHIKNRVDMILGNLEETLAKHAAATNAQNHEDYLGIYCSLCDILVVIIQKIDLDIRPFADRIMTNLIEIFKLNPSQVGEEAFLAVGAIAGATNTSFSRYMDVFFPILLSGLQQTEDFMCCAAAVGVVGDICRALGKQVESKCDAIVNALLLIVKDPSLNRSVKPPVLSVFGDIALAIEGSFERYFQPVVEMLVQASQACVKVDPDDEDMVEYMNQLRESILEAFTGILQGVATDNKQHLMVPLIVPVGEFIALLSAEDATRNQNVNNTCAGLIGDMASILGASTKQLMSSPFVIKMLNACAESDEGSAQQVANWARQAVLAAQQS